MDQHPVPQNISSYEFRLVGDMTLKQFFQLAGGVIGGVIIYRLPLPFFLKYPFAGLSILLGVMLAFVPVSGPRGNWIDAAHSTGVAAIARKMSKRRHDGDHSS